MQSRTNKQIQTPTTFYTVTEARQNPKACKMLSDWFSSFFVHADAKPEESEEQVTNNNGDNRTEGKPEEEEQKDEGETQETPEEEEEEEPEDVRCSVCFVSQLLSQIILLWTTGPSRYPRRMQQLRQVCSVEKAF